MSSPAAASAQDRKAGLGGMGGAQPLAVTMNHGTCLAADVDAQRIQRRLESSGENEIRSETVGELVMEALSNLDPVAYVRFASVYKNFREARDFEDFVGQIGGEGEIGDN